MHTHRWSSDPLTPRLTNSLTYDHEALLKCHNYTTSPDVEDVGSAEASNINESSALNADDPCDSAITARAIATVHHSACSNDLHYLPLDNAPPARP